MLERTKHGIDLVSIYSTPSQWVGCDTMPIFNCNNAFKFSFLSSRHTKAKETTWPYNLPNTLRENRQITSSLIWTQITLFIPRTILLDRSSKMCPWCNGYRPRKWTRQHEFKSWTKLIAFHIALIPLRKVWIQLFSLQLWVNNRTDWVLQPWSGN